MLTAPFRKLGESQMNCEITNIAAGLLLIAASVSPTHALAQAPGNYVDDLKMTTLTRTTYKLTWTHMASQACEYSISYAVYRSTTEDFEPSRDNQIATGIYGTSYVVHEAPSSNFYYYVRAVKLPIHCAVPALHTGKIFTFPLDYGATYTATIGGASVDCKATSTSEISCSGVDDFHAVIAQQYGHEFLIGCLSNQYEEGDWSCVNLGSNAYNIGVHSQTLTFFGTGFVKQITTTGRTVSRITPMFSILGLLK
jgi:hypothetical protein